jgi:hypothetical protein
MKDGVDGLLAAAFRTGSSATKLKSRCGGSKLVV